MEYREFRAKTVHDAVTEALIELEITSDMIEYEVIEEGSAGLLGLFSKDAVIRARRKADAEREEDLFDIKAEIRAGSLMKPEKSKTEKKSDKPAAFQKGAEGGKKGANAEAPRKAASNETAADKTAKQAMKTAKQNAGLSSSEGAVKQPKLSNKPADLNAARNAAEAKSENAGAKSENAGAKPENKIAKAPAALKDVDEAVLRQVLNEIFDKLEIKADIQIAVNKEERSVDITIDGDNTGDLIGKRGQTLDAIQYLLSIIVNKEQDSYFRVKLDTNNYRERRQKTLENLAKNMAAKVKKTRKKVALEPMNPYERRVIHSYLQADKMVTTKSEGEEPNRRVVIYYKKS